MNRFVCVLVLSCLLLPKATAQSAAAVHTVGAGDTLYGLVAQYYPERMARWTDVAVEIVALNPDSFPEGLDTVMKLGDELILVDYGQPLDTTPSNATAESESTKSSERPSTAPKATPPAPVTSADSREREDPVETAGNSVHKDTASETADGMATASDNDNQQRATQESTTGRVSIGQVISVTQRAMAIDKNNRQRPLAQNDDVYLGDAITTGINSTVSIRMLDDAEFRLQSSSRLMFERYQYDRESQRGSAVMTLVKGGFGTTSGLLSTHQPDAITVNTAVATIGVKGTRFALRVCATDSCRISRGGRSLEPGLYTGVIEGAIVISNNTGDLLTRRGEFFHVAAPNTVPEATNNAAALLFSAEQLELLDVEVKDEQPLGFLSWLKHVLFDD